MAHDFLIKDIAFQAGLSQATVDRVVNERGGVRRQTRLRVEAALHELRQQENIDPLSGRRYILDMVMEAPDRFTNAVRQAFESEATAFLPSLFKSRFHLTEQMRQTDLVRLLDRIKARGSHGVVLKGPDTPVVCEAVNRLEAAGIPVVTLVTDITGSTRSAYAGVDNRSAGATAAYLIGEKLRHGRVLVTLSSIRFRGEEEREIGFQRLMASRYPHIRITEISEGYGRDAGTSMLAADALIKYNDINAVYSIGGANRAVLAAFQNQGRSCECFVAHDLDEDNFILLNDGRLQYVLHHDLRADAISAYRAILNAHHGRANLKNPGLSALQIITPFNIPYRT